MEFVLSYNCSVLFIQLLNSALPLNYLSTTNQQLQIGEVWAYFPRWTNSVYFGGLDMQSHLVYLLASNKHQSTHKIYPVNSFVFNTFVVETPQEGSSLDIGLPENIVLCEQLLLIMKQTAKLSSWTQFWIVPQSINSLKMERTELPPL